MSQRDGTRTETGVRKERENVAKWEKEGEVGDGRGGGGKEEE